jgi:hypothetical protein
VGCPAAARTHMFGGLEMTEVGYFEEVRVGFWAVEPVSFIFGMSPPGQFS